MKQIIKDYTPETSKKKGTQGLDFHCYLARIAGNSILSLLIDFVVVTLDSLKTELGLAAMFYEQAKEAHTIIIECLIQQDTKAVEIAICNDILDVGRYMSDKTNSELFDPKSLQKSVFAMSGQPNSNNYQARVVWKDDSILNKSNIFSRRVGTSDLYIVFETELEGNRKEH